MLLPHPIASSLAVSKQDSRSWGCQLVGGVSQNLGGWELMCPLTHTQDFSGMLGWAQQVPPKEVAWEQGGVRTVRAEFEPHSLTYPVEATGWYRL